MLDQLIKGALKRKCPASTIMESIVAALILLIGFSAGMVIYSKVVTSSLSDQGMLAAFEQQSIADSIALRPETGELTFERKGLRFEVRLTTAGYGNQLRMQVKGFDSAGKQISGLNRIISGKDEQKD